jgi:hypothetical protein
MFVMSLSKVTIDLIKKKEVTCVVVAPLFRNQRIERERVIRRHDVGNRIDYLLKIR